MTIHRDKKTLKIQSQEFIKKIQKEMRKEGSTCTLSTRIVEHESAYWAIVQYRPEGEICSFPVALLSIEEILKSPEASRVHLLEQMKITMDKLESSWESKNELDKKVVEAIPV
jgi:hypothetical protein